MTKVTHPAGDPLTAQDMADEVVATYDVEAFVSRDYLEREKERLTAVEEPRYSLPLLTHGMDLAGLYDLAEALREQGAA